MSYILFFSELRKKVYILSQYNFLKIITKKEIVKNPWN